MKVKKAFVAHFSKLRRQPAALDRKVIGKLLPRKGDVKLIFSEALRHGRKIGHKLCTGSALSHVGKLFSETQVFFGKLAQQVPNDAAVMQAGRRAHVKHPLHINKHHGDRRFGDYAYIQRRAGGAGICGGKRLSCAGL